jgi:hypothetical protein
MSFENNTKDLEGADLGPMSKAHRAMAWRVFLIIVGAIVVAVAWHYKEVF